MLTKPQPARRTGTAIAAVLALTATPLFAQDVTAPADVLADPVAQDPANQPEPITGTDSITGQDAIVSLPETVLPEPAVSPSPGTATTVNSPIVQPDPTPQATPSEPATTITEAQPIATPPVSAAPVETAEPAPVATSPDPQPSAVPSEPATATTDESASAPARTQPAEPAPLAADETGQETSLDESAGDFDFAPLEQPAPFASADNAAGDGEMASYAGNGAMDNALEITLGVLLALGLGIGGVAMLRRGRRKQARKVQAVTRTKHPTARGKAYSAPSITPVAPAPASEDRDIREWALPLPQRRPVTVSVTAGGLANTGAAVPLPRTMPDSFAERDALIRRMIAAKPDRANPFVAPKARRRRARLILQSLGRSFEGRTSWIDLSQYPQNWPELARHSQTAAA